MATMTFTEPFVSATWGKVLTVEIERETEAIDTTALGHSHRQYQAGITQTKIQMTVEGECPCSARLLNGEEIRFDETLIHEFRKELTALRLHGDVLVTRADLQAGISEIECVSTGRFAIENTDPTAAAIRRRINEIRHRDAISTTTRTRA